MDLNAQQKMVDAILGQNIQWLIVVPASGLNNVYLEFEARANCLFVTREEEGVALASGLAAGGERPAVLMQQSGVGNCLNAVMTLSDPYVLSFPILVACRPEDDDNPVQQSSARRTNKILTDCFAVWLDWQSPSASDQFAQAYLGGQRWIAFPS